MEVSALSRFFPFCAEVVCLAVLASTASAQVIFGEQNFNAVSNSAFTTDELPAGSKLTNAGSANVNPALGLTYETFWAQATRANSQGPFEQDNDTSDFIGANSFTGSGAPDVGPDGTAVSAGSEQNFEFNDTDGRVELRFAPVDVSRGVSPIVRVHYWIASTGFESDDRFEILLTDGTITETLLAFGETELESNGSSDDGTANWVAFAAEVPDALDLTNVRLVIAVDNNSSAENVFIDDVAFLDFGQNFNLLSDAGTFTNQSAADGILGNSGSQSADGTKGLTFATYWSATRSGEIVGPVTAANDTSDFIGVNSFAGSNAPDVAPGGASVASGTEHNFEFNDGDGRLELRFDPVNLSGLSSPAIKLRYWITDTGYESDDRFEVVLTDGTASESLLSYSEPELEANASADNGSDNWGFLSADIPATLDLTQLQLVVAVDTNAAAENIFVDNIVFDNGGLPPPPPTPLLTSITQIQGETIQGASDASPLVGRLVEFTGVVTCDFQEGDQMRGFFMQADDGNPDTSDGVFVFDPAKTAEVQVGDEVTVVGTVQEYFGMTEITAVQSISVVSSGHFLSPTPVTLPETYNGELERYEGMLVEIDVEMTIAQNFFLARYGQMTMSSPDDNGNVGRLFQATNIFDAASSDALDLADANARRLLVLDDGQDISGLGDNPDPVPYYGFPPTFLRAGFATSGLTGCLDFGRINSDSNSATTLRDYRLHPRDTSAVVFDETNPRPSAPAPVGGRIKVAAFNVLNYFNGNGLGDFTPGTNPLNRGANSAAEFERQRDKIIDAITIIDADVVGLMEIENDGFGPLSAIQDLVDGLNFVNGAGTYAFVDPGTPMIGADAIAVGLIYQPAKVALVGSAAVLETGAFTQPPPDAGGNRPPLTQSFAEIATGGVFTVAVNHLKSKNDSGLAVPCAGNPAFDANCDHGDGQGFWNVRRAEAAAELAQWLAGDPTGSGSTNYLIIGDLNAYAAEDPIQALEALGFQDMIEACNPPSTGEDGVESGYSYTFDGLAGYLDHAIASPSLAFGITGATEWHINTDEAPVIDYNAEFKPSGYIDAYYYNDAYRASDHDPVIVGLDLCMHVDALHAVNAAKKTGDLRYDINLDGKVNGEDTSVLAKQLTMSANGACRLE